MLGQEKKRYQSFVFVLKRKRREQGWTFYNIWGLALNQWLKAHEERFSE